MIRFARSTTLLLAMMLGATACATDDVAGPTPAVSAPSLSSSSIPVTAPWSEIIVGETGPGALYELRMPENWNRQVIYYARGFSDATDPISLPFKENIDAAFDALGAKGYAIAASSFSENGFAVKDGVQRTHQLRGLFTSRFGRAEKSYLMGHSLGGAIVVELAERYPDQYDGALAMCGMVGGSQMQIDYLGNVRAAFDAMYPNAIRGDAVNIPADLTREEVRASALAAMSANPFGALALTALRTQQGDVVSPAQVEAPAGNIPAAIGAVLGALDFHVRGGADVIDHTQGHNPFSNIGVTYLGGVAPFTGDFIDSRIERFEASPDARNYLSHWFEPSGDLRIPTLTMHTLWDPAVPSYHELKLAALVRAAGNGEYLRTTIVPALAHCGFTTAQVVGSFEQLVAWELSLPN
jgi:pimeloyl-ACP methyl ester carboxylesterase